MSNITKYKKTGASAHSKAEKGDLVWDALLFNEITFEDEATHTKRSFGLKWDDEKTEKEFDEIVKKYGIS